MRKHIADEWARAIKAGKKRIEGRPYQRYNDAGEIELSSFAGVRPGDCITWYTTDGEEIATCVTTVRVFDSFNTIVAVYGIGQVLPGRENDTNPVGDVYGGFYSREIKAGLPAMAIGISLL